MSSNTRSTNWEGGVTAQDTVTGKQLFLTGTTSGGSFNLNVNGGGSGGGGTQYTTGDVVPSTPVGNAFVFGDGSNWQYVSDSSPLPTTATLGGSSVPISGATTAIGVAILDSSGDQISSFGGGTQYTSGNAIGGSQIGNALVFGNDTAWQYVTNSNPLPVYSPTAQVTNLTEVNGSGISLGQTTMSDSLPVTLASDQPGIPASQDGDWNVGSAGSTVAVGQQTVNTTAVQITASSVTPVNGIIVKALTNNSASIFIGGNTVTTSTGYELSPGEAISFTCNLNTLYIISVASTTDKICYNVE